MITGNQISPGMILSIDDRMHRVESCIKVTVAKDNPFVKATLKDLLTEKISEKNFKLNQVVIDAVPLERSLEYLYLEKENYLFLDIGNLEQVLVPSQIVGNKINYLKEGTSLKAIFYGNTVFSIELPQFLELLVLKTEEMESALKMTHSTKMALLETGAKIEVPVFIESGDIIKIDTQANEYIQRV
ncbi:MAG: elongation factor P [Chlamydiales bacterium]|nr:elongation factor P [Chlamydiales bacterium]